MKKTALLLIVVLIVSISLNAQNQLLQNPYPKTVAVTGSAEMDIIPDEIYVQVDLKEYRKKGNDKVNLEAVKSGFLGSCKVAGIPDSLISIAAYEGTNSNYWFWRRRKDPDLLAGISYQVIFSDSKKMDALIDKLDDEATINFQIIKVSHTKIEQFKKQLKTEAVKQAKEKALYLTAAIDEKLGEAVTISEPEEAGNYNFVLNNTSNISLKEMKAKDTFNGGEIPLIDFKKIKLKYTVAAVFALK